MNEPQIQAYVRALSIHAIPGEPGVEASACSCSLPPGCWGAGGWHHRRIDRAHLIAIEKNRFARLVVQQVGGEVPRQKLRAAWTMFVAEEMEAGRRDADGLDPAALTYLGIPVAIEPCRSAVDAWRKATAEKKGGLLG